MGFFNKKDSKNKEQNLTPYQSKAEPKQTLTPYQRKVETQKPMLDQSQVKKAQTPMSYKAQIEDQAEIRQEESQLPKPEQIETFQTPMASTWPWDREGTTFYCRYKPAINKNLTILLIENTIKVAQEASIIKKIVSSIVTKDLVCVIKYGSRVEQSDVFEAEKLVGCELINSKDLGTDACLFDALVELSLQVSKKINSLQDISKERVKISSIDVIGIGTCKDSGSICSKETGIECFCKAKLQAQGATKYFCLTEESFIDAAEIGFRSIGAISRKY